MAKILNNITTKHINHNKSQSDKVNEKDEKNK
jgi:hypothetical protein